MQRYKKKQYPKCRRIGILIIQKTKKKIELECIKVLFLQNMIL